MASPSGRAIPNASITVSDVALASAGRVQVFQHRLERGQVEPRWPVDRDPEVAPRDLAAEGGALEVKEARCALEVGQGLGVGIDQPVELGAGGQLEPQDVEELRIVPLQDAEQVGDVLSGVVDHLGPRT